MVLHYSDRPLIEANIKKNTAEIVRKYLLIFLKDERKMDEKLNKI